jgi:hypothetical protein
VFNLSFPLHYSNLRLPVGRTALHAAAYSGSYNCMDVLFYTHKGSKDGKQIRNTYNFKGSISTTECP